MIKRKQIQGDVAHGSTFNNSFTRNGILVYQCNGSVNHCDKFINSQDLTFSNNELNVTGAANISADVNVGCNLEVDGTTQLNDTLTVECATQLNDTLTVECATALNDTLDVIGDTTLHNTDVCGNLSVECCTVLNGDTCIGGALNVEGATNINDTVTIAGDLYVCGTRHEEHSADLYVGSDLVTLRDGASTALCNGQKAGIIVNNYDGSDSLGIVVDNTGTLKIGEYNTVKVYTEDDITFYSDRDLTTEIELPSGATLHKLGEDDDLIIYYYVTKDDTEPVATRSNSMNNSQLTCWNTSHTDIESINSQAACEGALLQYDVECDCYFHLENCGSGSLLEVDDTTGKLKWSTPATCDGQIPYFNGTSFTNTTAPTDTSLLQWNGSQWTPLEAGTDGQILTTEIDPLNPVKSLEWKSLPGIYVFNTIAEYNAVASTIPEGSNVIIRCVCNYTVSEDK